MKKVFVLLCALLTFTIVFCGCSSAAAKAEYNKGYNDGYEAGFEAGLVAPRQVAKPRSGQILAGREYDDSEITIQCHSTHDYVVSLKDSSGKEYVAFFVNAGDTVTVGVPGKHLYVYFASGTEWYGYGKGLMFGEDTYYSKDDEILDFTQYTWEYTLQPVEDGNFTESHSDEDEFF